jgi:hypothetical protein
MGFLSPASAPPPPPPPPPSATPPIYASNQVQAAGTGARARAAAASGAGFEGSLFTGPQGTPANNTAKGQLLGT